MRAPQRILRILYSAMACVSVAVSIGNAGDVRRLSFDSDVLRKKYLYTVYLPDGYDQTDAAFPVVYLLHGSMGDESNWLEFGDAERIFDELISSGKIPPTIVIMPGSESWWVDGANELAETAFVQELLPAIDSTWRTLPSREARVVAGLSAGGSGAVNFGLKYPDLFAATLALSPASYQGLPPEGSSAWGHPAFQAETGGFDAALWTRLNYESLIGAYLSQKTVMPFYIVSGDHDGLDIAYHAAVLFQRLREHQPDDVEFRVIDGGHEWDVWKTTLPDALEFAFRFIDPVVPPRTNPSPFSRFEGTWSLKNDEFKQVWDGKTVETLTIPEHRTKCSFVNTIGSILCIVDAGGLKGHILWASEADRQSFGHLSHFGEARMGQGSGRIQDDGDLRIEIKFSDEPDGSYRIYHYNWTTEDEYVLISRQYDAAGKRTGNWYGGTFTRIGAK